MQNKEMTIEQQIPQGFILRRPTMDDLAVVTELTNIYEIDEYGKSETTLDDTSTAWQRPGFHLAQDAWIVLAPDGRVVGYTSVGHRQHTQLFTPGRVHPAYRGRGIGTLLLRLAEERAKEHLTKAPSGIRVTLFSEANSKNSEAQRFLEGHGFTLIRYFWRMGIELREAPPTAQWAEKIVVRTMAPGMERAIFEADDEAFRDHWGYMPDTFEDWSHWTFKRESFDPSLCFLAMDGTEIAGIALCADEESGGWVHTLGVRRPWRRMGVGLALLHHAFTVFYSRNIHNVYLGVDAQSLTGATRLYERAGMHVVRQYKNYEKELRAGKELSTQSVDV